ncbi:MAG: aminotransferase class I/II-fold pyridoxal phosphate-dependent enzyme, partial [Bacteriovoracaceae bacterium]|nr:aminotransferase class I/II-fold pyridoxal phosphate-dependent enzyme [Bacteriovoracaceae bacterium]
MKPTSEIVKSFEESIFTTITQLANKKGAINLSQGMPDFDGPSWVRDYAINAIRNGQNQQAPAHGIVELRESISDITHKNYGIRYCPANEVTVTTGATEALFSSILALINPGDEVIVIEPFFDTYIPAIKMAGGIPVISTLKFPNFRLDFAELAQLFGPKTKLLILNTPHNPTGTILTRSELEQLRDLLVCEDCYLLSDEVYEYLTFDNESHISPASIDGLFERTITISSTGKTLGLTGWRIGWANAPKEIAHQIRMVHQNNTFSAPRPLQEAMAKGLRRLDEYLPSFRENYTEKRDLLLTGLKEAGFSPITPKSSYFILCPIPDDSELNSIEYVKELIEKRKVAAIPCSPFYSRSKEGEGLIR